METLRAYRRSAGFTLKEMARKLWLTPASLSRIERGEQWPDKRFFERVHAVTKGAVTPNDLILVRKGTKT
jgi:transcriptional regulator with XRE-family HTH domain